MTGNRAGNALPVLLRRSAAGLARRAGRLLRTALALVAGTPLLTVAGVGALDVQGHRGARGLEPENTLAAFHRALNEGVTTLELDVGVTADGVAVVHHDRRLNPDLTRTGSGQWISPPGSLLRDLTLAELQSFDVGRVRPGSAAAAQFPQQQARDGERIPSLAALLRSIRQRATTDPAAARVAFNIETKLSPLAPEETTDAAGFVRAIGAAIQAAGWPGLDARITLQSFDWRTLKLARTAHPAWRLACLSSELPRFNTVSDGVWTDTPPLAPGERVAPRAQAAGCAIWSPAFATLTPEQVMQARQIGLRVVPWTVNSEDDMRRLLAMGVDGLITDYPDRLLRLVQQEFPSRLAPPPGTNPGSAGAR